LALRSEDAACGVADGLADALSAASGAGLDLARDILKGERGIGTAPSVLRALPPPSLARGPSIRNERIEEMVALMERFLRFPWQEPIAGVRIQQLLGSAQRVELEAFDNDDKVRVTSESIQVAAESMKKLALLDDVDRRLALCALYFVHELVHVGQGIGDKSVVARVRATGSEPTLLQLDLAADHAAACVVPHVLPRWTTAALKDLQVRSLMGYPATWMHTLASRERKALRVVSLRLDALLRVRTRDAARIGDGYVFVAHGPAGGSLVALASGPPPVVLHACDLVPADATVLASIGDEGQGDDAGIARLDSVLKRMLSLE
jgi:hypothetical protein